VTFLFTDVEGSTRRWETDADGMRTALAAHDEVLRGASEVLGGVRILRRLTIVVGGFLVSYQQRGTRQQHRTRG
jgi:class 3 adenylate cyclase